VAVNVLDIEVTHQGLAHGHRGCVEKGEDPRPSRGDLCMRDMPVTVGTVAWDVIVRKLRLPFAGPCRPRDCFLQTWTRRQQVVTAVLVTAVLPCGGAQFCAPRDHV